MRLLVLVGLSAYRPILPARHASLSMTAISDAFASIAAPIGDVKTAEKAIGLVGSAWHLSLNLGPVDDAKHNSGFNLPPPKEWAISGARHPPLHVHFCFEEYASSAPVVLKHAWWMAPHGWSGTDMRVSTTESARFVGLNGEEAVAVGGGEARLTPVPHARSSMMHLRFGFELTAGVRHHDISLPAGSYLVLCTECWSDVARLESCVDGVRRVEEEKRNLEACLVQAQQAVTSHPWQAVNLLLKDGWLPDLIFNKRLELSERRSELPGAQVGTVQGPGQMVVARSGLVCVAREQSGALGVFGRTIYEAVGTFSIRDGAS